MHFFDVMEVQLMKKKIISFVMIIVMCYMSLPIGTYAVSLDDKEKIYRAKEWELDKAQAAINWLCTDDNFAHHKHTNTSAAKFTMFTYLAPDAVNISNLLFNNPSEYRKSAKEIILTVIDNNEDDLLLNTQSDVASDVIDILLQGVANYMKTDGVITSTSNWIEKISSEELKQLQYIFVDGEGVEHFNNFVLDHLPDNQKDLARESVRKYFNSQNYMEDLSVVTDVVSLMKDILTVTQDSIDVLIELETYKRSNDNILHFLRYLYNNALNEQIRSVASELYISYFNTYEQNYAMAKDRIKNIILESAASFSKDVLVDYIKTNLSVSGIFTASAKLGIATGNIVSDMWFNTSDTKEITSTIFILNDLASDLSKYVSECQQEFNTSCDNIIVNTNSVATDAGHYINAVQMLLDVRKKGEERFYALKNTVYSADILSIIHLFDGFSDNLESLEKWYAQRNADFITASNTLFSYIETSKYENKYEYVFESETFNIEDGVLIEYTGSDSRISTPDDIIAIGTQAFKAETSLISVSITGSPTLRSEAFYNCQDLRTVFIPETVTDIEDYAFYNCNNLTIYGYLGSAAESYAIEYDIPFVAWNSDENYNIWDGTIASGFSGGDGTSYNPYQITNAEELAYLSKYVNNGGKTQYTYFSLTNDIVLNNSTTLSVDNNGNILNDELANRWIPIGNSQYKFEGSFYGNGHTISGLYINDNSIKYTGLFGTTEDADIYDIGLVNTYILNNHKNATIGGITAYEDSSYGIVKNCYVEGWLKSNSGNSIVCGILGSANWTPKITNCYNLANIQSSGSCMGIASEGKITNCHNEGNITATGDDPTYDYAYASYAYGIAMNGSLENCYNIGEISSQNSGAFGVGGYDVVNCYNTGNISSNSETASGITDYGNAQNCYNTGDIVGNVAYGIGGNATNCFNRGNIMGNAGAHGIASYGSIYECYNEGNISAQVASGIGGEIVENSYNLGKITAIASEGASCEASGISVQGYGQRNNFISDCYNKGDIESAWVASGISASCTQIKNCINYGIIKGKEEVSGIGKGEEIVNCKNYGEIKGDFDVSGICGEPDYCTTRIKECINYGKVTGIAYVGGIFGGSSQYKSEEAIEASVNYGIITGVSNVGGIAGCYRGTIRKCANYGIIDLDVNNLVVYEEPIASLGGIAGFSGGLIADCENNANITIDENISEYGNVTYVYVGGIAGETENTIYQSKNNGNIELIIDNYITIIACGIAANGGIVNQCYNTADIISSGDAAGISNGLDCLYVYDSFNCGNISGKNNSAGIALDGIAIITCYNVGKISSDSGCNFDISSSAFYNCYYPSDSHGYLTGAVSNEEMLDKSSYKGFDFDNIWTINSDDKYPYPQFIYELSNLEDSSIWKGDIAEGFASGDGSKENPYVISNAEELAYFASTTKQDWYGERYEDQYIILNSDIKLNDNTIKGWTNTATPLMKSICDFYGIFDGNGYTISGIYSEAKGLFDNNYGCIKNLNVADSHFANASAMVSGSNYGFVENCSLSGNIEFVNGAGIVSNNWETGTISQCENNANSLISGSEAGIIASKNYGTIIQCVNKGTITCASEYFGGIVGYNDGNIEECFNTGNITVLSTDGYVGGIVGRNCWQIKNCYNTGNINNDEICYTCNGGIVGYQDTSGIMQDVTRGSVRACYNIGKINGYDIVGYNPFNSVYDCYYPSSGNDEYGTSIFVEELCSQHLYEGFDFISSWGISPNVNNGLPYLQFAEYSSDYSLSIAGETYLSLENGVLVVNTLNILPSNTSFEYKWYKNDELILNANENMYVLSQNDIGSEIHAKVTARYCSGEITTNKIIIEGENLSGTINIIGEPYVNCILSIDVSNIIPKGAQCTYQWFCDRYPIPNETNSTYLVSEYDVNCEITVRVIGVGIFSGEIESQPLKIQDKIIGNINDSVNWLLDRESETLIISGSGVIDYNDLLYNYANYVRNLIIEDGIVAINDYSFDMLYNLQNITLSKTVLQIGEYAFDRYLFDGLTIYGYKDSYAETYANTNNITFLPVEVTDLKLMTNVSPDNNGNIIVNIETNTDISGALVHTAIYTSEGRLLKWGIASKLGNNHYSALIPINDFSIEDIGYIKSFVWDSIQGLKPMCNSDITYLKE